MSCKKFGLLLCALFLLLLLPGASSLEFGDILGEAKEYARQYDYGEINYLQFRVYVNSLREKIYGEFFGSDFGQGQAPEQDIALFGLFKEAENAYISKDSKKLEAVMDKIEGEFEKKGEKEAIKILNALRQAIKKGDQKRAQELGKKLEELFREGERQKEFQGWSREKVEELFGPATEFQDRVWVENLKRDVRVKEPVAVWRKMVFEGKKITLTFNAWPNLAEYKDRIVAYYWVDFETRFNKGLEVPDTNKLLEEIKQRLSLYYDTGEGGGELAELIVKSERAMNDVLWQNRNSCNETMLEFFEKAKGNSQKIQWKGTFFEGEQGEVLWFLDEMTDDKWHGFHTWFEAMFSQQPKFESEFGQFDKQKAFGEKVERNIGDFESQLLSIKQDLGSGNIARLKQKEFLLNEYLSILTEKANREDDPYSVPELSSMLEELFNKHAKGFVKEQIKTTDYRISLLNVSRQRVDAYCRGESKWCGEGFSCFNSDCVSAKGGNEVCDNGIDDDSDNVADCEDPDCAEFLSCGRICEPACNLEDGCWKCQSENCKQQCDACGECNKANPNNNEACSSTCNECSKCTNAYCTDRCDECWRCENKNYGEGCYDECKACNACNLKEGQDCGQECVSCNNCRFNAGKITCPAESPYSTETGWCLEQPQAPQTPEEQPQTPQEGSQAPEGEQPQAPEPEQQCTVQCPEGQQLNPEKCVCFEVEKPSDGNQAQLSSPSLPIFPSIGTGFAVLVRNASEEQQEPQSCEKITCSVNQSCNPENGYCECQKGFWDCDGDWQNGCESSVQCTPCETDEDCAKPRCSQDRFSVDAFKCVRGEPWEETIAGFEFGGSCEKRTNGEEHGNVWFGGWGERIGELDRLKNQVHAQFQADWCEQDLASKIKERIELQKSFNDEFLDWFFDEFVSQNPGEYKLQEESIFLIYEAFQRNSEETARSLNCLNRGGWPEEFKPISVSMQSPNGKIKFWEETKQTNFLGKSQQILSPYMELWVFPSKEQFKKIISMEFEKEGPKGPSAVEVAQMRQNEKAMQVINRISDAFGGEARILIAIKDKKETVIQMLFTVNKESLVQMTPLEKGKKAKPNATIFLGYDFFYDTVSTVAKDVEGSRKIKPHWEENEFEPPRIDDALMAITLFSRVIYAIPTGQVRVEPITAVPTVIMTLTDMMGLMQMK